MAKFVAVVLRTDGLPSNAPDHGWAASVADTKADATRDALRKAKRWGEKGVTEYQVLVGQFTERAEIPLNYQLVPLDETPQE